MTTETVTLGHVNLTIPPRNTDDDAWRARIEARREENRRRIELEQAAKNPPKRPVVATPKQPREPRQSNAHPAPCPGCGRMTRPTGSTIADYPDTIKRRGTGRCYRCEVRANGSHAARQRARQGKAA